MTGGAVISSPCTWRIRHSQPSAAEGIGPHGVEQVVRADHATLAASSTRYGRRTSAANAIMLIPSAQNTSRMNGGPLTSKKNPARTTVNSSTISHKPRVSRNRERSAPPGLSEVEGRRPQIRPRAGEEHEHRRAEMRDPPGHEDRRRRPAEILGLERHRRGVDVVARVVERHDHHDETTKDVQRLEVRGLSGNGDLGGAG